MNFLSFFTVFFTLLLKIIAPQSRWPLHVDISPICACKITVPYWEVMLTPRASKPVPVLLHYSVIVWFSANLSPAQPRPAQMKSDPSAGPSPLLLSVTFALHESLSWRIDLEMCTFRCWSIASSTWNSWEVYKLGKGFWLTARAKTVNFVKGCALGQEYSSSKFINYSVYFSLDYLQTIDYIFGVTWWSWNRRKVQQKN